MWSEQKSPPRPLSQPLPSVDAFTHLTYGQKNALSGSIWFVCGFRVTGLFCSLVSSLNNCLGNFP